MLDEEIEKLRRDAHPYQLSLMRLSLLPMLRAFVRREQEYRSATYLRPQHFELSFGQSPASEASGEQPDAASIRRGIEFHSANSAPISVYGRMDRVDTAPDGSAAVIDYKLGAGRDLKAMQNGDSLQIPLYFMALEQVFGLKVAAGFYDSFAKNERKPIVRSDCIATIMAEPHKANGGILSPPQYQQLLTVATGRVVQVADEIAARRIQPTPDDQKCSLCDFHDVCRA